MKKRKRRRRKTKRKTNYSCWSLKRSHHPMLPGSIIPPEKDRSSTSGDTDRPNWSPIDRKKNTLRYASISVSYALLFLRSFCFMEFIDLALLALIRFLIVLSSLVSLM